MMSSRIRILTSSSGKAVKTDKVDVSAEASCLEALHCGALCWLPFIFQLERLFWTVSPERETWEKMNCDDYSTVRHHCSPVNVPKIGGRTINRSADFWHFDIISIKTQLKQTGLMFASVSKLCLFKKMLNAAVKCTATFYFIHVSTFFTV